MNIHRVPLGEQVYREILDLVHLGEFPPGARVRDTALAARLGVSRTPVREALLRLTREGVLAAETGRGFSVRPLDRGELRDAGVILAQLEPLALSLSPTPGPDRLERLEETARRLEQVRGDVGLAVELDETWHAILLEECPNRRLLDLIGTLRLIPRRYLHAYLRGGGRLSLSTLHHTRLLASLRSGDRGTAAGLLERRWRKGIEEMESWIQ